jgi:hypothetical protein
MSIHPADLLSLSPFSSSARVSRAILISSDSSRREQWLRRCNDHAGGAFLLPIGAPLPDARHVSVLDELREDGVAFPRT